MDIQSMKLICGLSKEEKGARKLLKWIRRNVKDQDTIRLCLLALNNATRSRKRVGKFFSQDTNFNINEYERHLINFFDAIKDYVTRNE